MMKTIPARHKRCWTNAEDEYLAEKWGSCNIRTLMKNLQRSKGAVLCRARVLGLGHSRYASGIMYSPPQIAEILGKCTKTVYALVDDGTLKGRRKRLANEMAFQVHVDDLLQFLKDNQDMWDSRNLEPYALGIEPDWMKEKRRKDMILPRQNMPWTRFEEKTLKQGIQRGDSMKEIAEGLGRSLTSIYRRAQELRCAGELKPRKIQLYWTDAEVEMLLQMDKQGLTDKEIAYRLGREAAHITDKRRRMRMEGQYHGFKIGMRNDAIKQVGRQH